MARRLACPWAPWRCGGCRIRIVGVAGAPLSLLRPRRAPRAGVSHRDQWRARSWPTVSSALATSPVQATFIVAYLRSAEGFSGKVVTRFWSILGLSSVAAAFVWGRILGRLKGGWGTAATLGLLTIGTAAARMEHAGRRLSVRRSLRGPSFSRSWPPWGLVRAPGGRAHAVTAAIATLTVVFGIGQCIGPVLSGALSRWAERPQGWPVAVGRDPGGRWFRAFQREPAG